MSRLRLNKRSFTLIELVMAIIVVGVVAIPLSILIGEHIPAVFQSEDYAMALNLARYEIEVVNNLAYTSILDASYLNYQGYNYDVTRTVTYAQGSAVTAESMKKITVNVMKSGSAQTIVSLMTYVARNVSYGL